MVEPARAGERADALLAEAPTLGAILAMHPRRTAALVGEAAATLLAAHRAAARYALREAAVRGAIVSTRYELIDYCHHAMAHDRDESLRVFFVNSRRELIAEEIVARGGPDRIAIEPRQVLVRALDCGATGLILVHNHPGGDPVPSEADRRFTRRLATAAACLGIRLHDHLVVARDGWDRISIAE